MIFFLPFYLFLALNHHWWYYVNHKKESSILFCFCLCRMTYNGKSSITQETVFVCLELDTTQTKYSECLSSTRAGPQLDWLTQNVTTLYRTLSIVSKIREETSLSTQICRYRQYFSCHKFGFPVSNAFCLLDPCRIKKNKITLHNKRTCPTRMSIKGDLKIKLTH